MKYVVTADLHLRWTVPSCRTESLEAWIKLQFDCLSELYRTAQKENCKAILVAGDFFDKSNGCPSWFMANLIRYFKQMEMGYDISIYTIPGQHDLPQHRIEALYQSNLGVLMAAGVVTPLIAMEYSDKCKICGIPYGCSLTNAAVEQAENPANVILFHGFTTDTNEGYPGMEVYKAKDLQRLFKTAAFIVTGDNHRAFVYGNIQDTIPIVVNCGPMTQQTVDLTTKPVFFVIDVLKKRSKQFSFPHSSDSIRHIEPMSVDSANIEALANRLMEADNQIILSFRKAVLNLAIQYDDAELIQLLEKTFKGGIN